MAETTERNTAPEESVDSRIDIFLMLHTFFREFRRWWWISISLAFVFAAGMYYRANTGFVPMYQSSASFTVTAATSSSGTSATYSFYYDSSTASQMAATFPYILESELLTDLVKNDLGVETLNGTISASAVESSNLFTLSVTSTDPQAAYDILESVIANYSSVSRYVIGDTQLNMIEEPTVADTPYNSRSGKTSAAKGGAAGLVLGLLIIFLFGQLRRTIRRETEIKDNLNVECAGVIPKVLFKSHRKEIDRNLSIENKYLGDGFRESIRAMVLRMDKSMKEKKQQIILVTGTGGKEGVSTVAQNVALALAELDNRVVLVNGKVLRSAEDFTPNPEQKGGLDDVIQDMCSLKEALHPFPCKNDKLEYLDCRQGLTRRRMLTASSLFHRLFDRLTQNCDYVVIDAPPCSRMEELTFLAENANCILFVIKQDCQPISKIAEAIDEVCSYGAELFGCVLNQVEEGGLGGYGYSYSGKYGKYYGNYSYHKYGYGRKKYGYGYGHKKYGYGYGYGHSYGKTYGHTYGGDRYGYRDEDENEDGKEDK